MSLVAEEFNSLFFRNAVNAGLPAMTVPEATTVNLAAGTWTNQTTKASGSGPVFPDLILDPQDVDFAPGDTNCKSSTGLGRNASAPGGQRCIQPDRRSAACHRPGSIRRLSAA